jgi:branched-chain amino acid transport system permease protein
VVISVAFSLIVGFPTLRLRGPYFALAMLSASAIRNASA